MADVGGNVTRVFRRDCSVRISVSNIKDVRTRDVCDGVEKLAGEGSVIGIVPVGFTAYEITLSDICKVKDVSDGIHIKGEKYDVRPMGTTDELIVSIMHMFTYINDDDIKKNLENFRVSVKSIRRHYYRGSNNVADGTRICVVKKLPGFVSLPYRLKFKTRDGIMHFQVKHDNMVKTCNYCNCPGHVIKDCPDVVCRECGDYGHIQAHCTAQPCSACMEYQCMCEPYDDVEEHSSVDAYEKQVDDRLDRFFNDPQGGLPDDELVGEEGGCDSDMQGKCCPTDVDIVDVAGIPVPSIDSSELVLSNSDQVDQVAAVDNDNDNDSHHDHDESSTVGMDMPPLEVACADHLIDKSLRGVVEPSESCQQSGHDVRQMSQEEVIGVSMKAFRFRGKNLKKKGSLGADKSLKKIKISVSETDLSSCVHITKLSS